MLSGTLPLDSSKYKNIAVIGPNANATSTMQANYKVRQSSNGNAATMHYHQRTLQGNAPYLISPLEGLQKIDGVTVSYSQGCDVSCGSTSGFADAASVASKADVTIVVIGLTTAQER